MTEISDEKFWRIFKSHYQQHGVARHQIETFDDFLENGIQRILQEEPDIVVERGDLRYSVSFSDPYIPEPEVVEDGLVRFRDRNPAEARMRNLTYESNIYVNVTEYTQNLKKNTISKELPEPHTLTTEERHTVYEDYLNRFDEPSVKTHYRVPLAKIPIMLHSSRCRLRNMSDDELIENGEDIKDRGGYFVISGKERVLISQTRINYNQVTVKKGKADKKIDYTAELRSMSEETGHSVLVSASLISDSREIVMTLPYVKDQVPVGIVFRAMGIETLEDISEVIGISHPKAKKYITSIYRDGFRYDVQSAEDAIAYIASCVTLKTQGGDKLLYAQQVIDGEIFPHMGMTASKREKILFLGHIIKKLILVVIGLKKVDSRDDYRNKRIESAGDLLHGLFRTLFKQYVSEIKKSLLKKKTSLDIKQEMKTGNKITNALRHSFYTGNWAVQKANYTRVGVCQILQRYYGASIAHLRKIMIPDGKDSKSKDLRQLNSSQCGFICPWDTPEGGAVGVVLSMTLFSKMSVRVPTVIVQQIVDSMISLEKITNETKNSGSKVFINGSLVGFAKNISQFVDEFKTMRKMGQFTKDISIGVTDNAYDKEINICSDEGRIMKPVFTVEQNNLALTEDMPDDWDELVNNDIIAYVDNNEVAEMVGTFDQGELSQYNCDFFEHPICLMSLMASVCPFANHAPSPRLCYSANMAKQSVGQYAITNKIRSDTVVHTMAYPQAPIVRSQTATIFGFNDRPAGVNAVVAIMTYGGCNQEDSVIINKSAIDRGLLVCDTWRTYTEESKREPPNREIKIGIPPPSKRRKDLNYSLLAPNGVINLRVPKESTKIITLPDGTITKETSVFNQQVKVQKNDVIIGKYLVISDKSRTETEISDCSLVIKKGEEGYIEKIFESIAPTGFKLVKVTIRTDKTPEIGDKVAARSAQKGVIGMVYNQADMPFTADGIVPDILMNPHALPSRMTLNQIMESLMGKTNCIQGEFGDATPFSSPSQIISDMSRALEDSGFTPYGVDDEPKEDWKKFGYETMFNGMTGEKFEAKIYIGVTYYQRLKHFVSDKEHARARGPLTSLMRQPTEGRSKDGGLRAGEMERDCILSHGSAEFLKDRLLRNSDDYEMVICNICGNIATSQYSCKGCNTNSVSKINIPYAFKIIVQELAGMNIRVRMKAEN